MAERRKSGFELGGWMTYASLIIPGLFIVILFLILPKSTDSANVVQLLKALTISFAQMLFALAVAAVTALALTIIWQKTGIKLRAVFAGLFCIPVLALFPLVNSVWVSLWILASLIILLANTQGLNRIPGEYFEMAKSYGMSGISYYQKFLLPALFGSTLRGLVVSWIVGWNVIVFAEPSRSEMGSQIKNVVRASHYHAFFEAFLLISVALAVGNILLQKSAQKTWRYDLVEVS